MGPTTAVTVVIPTKDRAQLLAQTVAAVLAQRDVAVEVIIVDDGSAQPGALADDRVRVHRNERSAGVAAARNAGLALATSRWTAFTDDDDLWAPDKLARQLLAVSSTPGAAWSCVGTAYVDEGLELLSRGLPPPSGEVSSHVLARNSIPGGGSGVLADTELLRELGGFDPDLGMCADYELWIRLALASPLAAVDDPLLAYRVHGGGMSRQLEVLRHDLNEIERRHGAARRERGVAVQHFIQLWAGDRLQRSRRRVPSARAYLRAAGPGIPRWLAVARAAEGLLWPGAHRFRDRRRVAAVPAAWAEELESWLGPLRARLSQPNP